MAAVDPFALSESIEFCEQSGLDTITSGERSASEWTPRYGGDAELHALVEGAIAHRVQAMSRELGLVGGDWKVEVFLQSCDLGQGVVGNADLPDFAGDAQFRERRSNICWVGV